MNLSLLIGSILLLAATTQAQQMSPMPDPLIGEDGQRITSADQWPKRRQEMKKVIEQYLTGHAPPAPGNVKGEELDAHDVMNGKVKFTRVRLSFGPEQKLNFEVAIFMPATGDGPFPTIVQPSFFPTPGTTPSPPPTVASTTPTSAPSTQAIERLRMFARMADPQNAVETYADALSRGYAIITFNYQECGADRRDGYRDTGFFAAYPDYDWADLASWAWGMSRCVDYLETQPWADKTKFIAVGHSRLGKATLIAGAFDERFALVAPAGSGCAGTGAFRFNGKDRGGKEGLENVVANFPQWISPNLAQFSGKVETLPFDQHWLIAMVAPRAFIAADGLDDSACNGNALKQSYLAAMPVYDFLGVKQKLGIHFRPGKHMLAPEDWSAILDFADQQLRGKQVDKRFDELPAAELLH